MEMAIPKHWCVRTLGWMGAGLVGFFGVLAHATTMPQPVQTLEQAKERYDADKKLCAAEASPELRLQCRRDAQAAYDKAVANLKAKGMAVPKVACLGCGKVTAVHAVEKPGDSNAVGLIAGGVAGAVLGRQVGGGTGKDLATVAGAVGGAYAGKRIQEKMNARTIWKVGVAFDDGSSAEYDFAADPGLKVGDKVKKSGQTVVRR
ncbi:MAG: hypothetical protein OHK0048_14110 [Rhodoferax sp.]